jgi:transposase
MDACYVGIDVSKDRLDVCVLPAQERFQVSRDGPGIEALARRLDAFKPTHVGMEATGGFETIAAAGLSSAGLPVLVVNPAQVRPFAKALGQRAKSDPIDAGVIAAFLAATHPEVRPMPDAAARLLADLVARRRQIVDMRAAETQRLARTSNPRLAASIARLVKALERELEAVDADLDLCVRGSPVWRELEDLLTSVKGVGEPTARVLIADLPELGRIDRKKIAALVGLCPYQRSSGRFQGRTMIAGGRASVTTALFMAAQSAQRSNPPLKAFFTRLLNAGLSKMAATIAVARKLLIILNAIARTKQPWKIA